MTRTMLKQLAIKAWRWIVARAAEKSTWAGLATGAVSVGFPAAVPLINVVGGIVSGALVAWPETPAPENPTK